MTRHATDYGAYEVTPLPGQPQVAVCHGFMVPQDMRGRGYGHMLKAHQGATLRAQLHDFAICTVAAGNAAQQRVLEAAGWKKGFSEQLAIPARAVIKNMKNRRFPTVFR